MIGIPLRVNYKQTDYIYYIISAPTKKELIINILLDGKNYTLVPDENKLWVEQNQDVEKSLDPGLALAIGRAVSLRYHI